MSEKKKYTSSLHDSDDMIGAVKGDWVFQLPITSKRWKERGVVIKNIMLPRMKQNSRELSATKAPSKNAFCYARNK